MPVRGQREAPIDNGLRASLLTPDLVAEFIAEYTTEWNRLQRERQADAKQRDRKLAEVNRKVAAMLDAIERGIITASTKERLETLEAEKAALESTPVAPVLPTLHPKLMELYRNKVAHLEAELADPELAAEAKSVLRSMIKTIKIYPGAKRGEVDLELHGELATVLGIAQARNKGGTPVSRIQVSVVAGARTGRYRQSTTFAASA